MNDDGVVKVLMGFNPVNCARANTLENWNRSFRDVAIELEQHSTTASSQQQHSSKVVVDAALRRHFVLNPVVGPEAITGSTRMKGLFHRDEKRLLFDHKY